MQAQAQKKYLESLNLKYFLCAYTRLLSLPTNMARTLAAPGNSSMKEHSIQGPTDSGRKWFMYEHVCIIHIHT